MEVRINNNPLIIKYVETTVETDSSHSSSTLNNVPIREEDEDEEDIEPQAKKRKVKVNVSYFVQRVCQNEDEALEIIRSEKIWANFCRSNETAEGTKSYYPCKNKGCPKKTG